MSIGVMLDLETLGTKDNATIFQLSAVAFDLKNKVLLGKEYNAVLDLESHGYFEYEQGTLDFWEKHEEVFNKILSKEGKVSEEEMIKGFNDYLLDLICEYGDNITLWGNGPLFDNKKVYTQFEKYGVLNPINFWNDRDVRTVLELASIKSGKSPFAIKNKIKNNEAHNAIEDCKYQIKLIFHCLDIM